MELVLIGILIIVLLFSALQIPKLAKGFGDAIKKYYEEKEAMKKNYEQKEENKRDVAEELKKLAELHDKGILTDEEFGC